MHEIGIIQSILDSDLYKFSMQQAVCKMYPNQIVRYEFCNRGQTKFPLGFAEKLRDEVAKMSNLALTKAEQKFLLSRGFFDPVYVDFLTGYRFDANEVTISQTADELQITIQGYWYRTILWEVPLMALISELYFLELSPQIFPREVRRENNHSKATVFCANSLKLAEFGTRRRYSYANQFEVCQDLQQMNSSEPFFVGSSNPYISMQLGLNVLGTQAHEWFMFMGAHYGVKMANYMALEKWVEVYGGNLGIALTDTYTSEVFFKTFNMKFAKLFDGVRHDSGCPFQFIDKAVAHYLKLGITPATKTIIFSDGLDSQTALAIASYCHKSAIGCSFGIGTNLTNDLGVQPLNMVIKMTAALIDNELVETVKLSDEISKHSGESAQIKLIQQTLGLV